MRIVVDRQQCIGAGECVMTAPQVFDQDDEGSVRLLAPEPAGEQHDQVRTAAAGCPVQAIAVHDDR